MYSLKTHLIFFIKQFIGSRRNTTLIQYHKKKTVLIQQQSYKNFQVLLLYYK